MDTAAFTSNAREGNVLPQVRPKHGEAGHRLIQPLLVQGREAFARPILHHARPPCRPAALRPGVRKGIVRRTLQTPPDKPCGTKRNGVSHGWYEKPIIEGTVTVTHLVMTTTLIGYARRSTDKQDLAAQKTALKQLGIAAGRIYTDHGLTGTNRLRPGLDQAPAAVRTGDALVVPKLDRLARSVPDARFIADALVARGVKLALGSSVYDPVDPMGQMFFTILATFAGFEADLIRLRTREGMAIARSRGKLRGKQPKFSDKQKELRRMHDTGDYSISDPAELFSVSRPTVYRTLGRQKPATHCSSSEA